MNGSDHNYEDSHVAHDPDQAQEHEHVQDGNDLTTEPISIDLPLDIPSSDLGLDLSAIIGPSEPPTIETEKVQKRASNVLKLSQEHEKLKQELRAMTERLEAAERKQKEFMARTRGGTSGENNN